MNIYIANFDTQWSDEQLKEIFVPYGTVENAHVMIDGFTEQSRGFGYVEMPNESEAVKAIEALNNRELNGLKLHVVQSAAPVEKRGSYKVGNSVNPYRFRKN